MKNAKKRTLAFISLSFSLILNGIAQTIPMGSKITVSPPVMQNGTADDGWIPLFIQGQLTTDFQNYSWLTVIDRQTAAQLSGEQALKEQSAYVSGEDVSIEYASMVSADYMVAVNVLKKGASYAIDSRILDVRSSSTVGKSYSAPSVSESSLNDGSAIHAASYELLKGLGVEESKLSALKPSGKSQSLEQSREVSANIYVARGMAVEQSGGSVVDAMAYYQKAVGSSKTISEGAARLEGLTSTLTGVSMGKVVLNDIQLRNKWVQIWKDYRDFVKNNWACIVYSPASIRTANIDYNNNTTDLRLPVFIKANPDCRNLYDTLLSAYKATPKQGDWRIDTEWGVLGSYTSYRESPAITISVYDGAGVCIASKTETLRRTYYDSYAEYKSVVDVPHFVENLVTLSDVDPNKITDNIKIEIKPSCAGGSVKALPFEIINQ